ncbi:hypothetical protein AC622_03195 [Bacillus sp. FJAT-27916]|uniref:tyrosine-type recombinase/integrase n=1 Tax=Bacillus sp. FJAT-27916 TaxID=1679169 RepID=UPI000670CB9D|nr:tyrosine-type recombinase/integrase [Bacillus sp. FJAT-27916]KMY43382.1 hypothetical protein AC622_03195 [Bacillus sp. FJAT-27916]
MAKIKKNKEKNYYYFRESLGYDAYGKRCHPYKSGFKTKGEAEIYQAKLRIAFAEGTYVKASKTTFLEFIKEWFEFYRRNVEKTTAQNRWPLIKNHIVPYFEGKRLDKITPRMLDDFYSKKLGEGLSGKTVRELHNLLNRAFSQAVKWSYLQNNPVANATPPRVVKKEMVVWDEGELKRFLRLIESRDDYALYLLLITTGMRKGELLGLKWCDVDFDKGKLHIRRSLCRVNGEGLVLKNPKTTQSNRQISISSYVRDVLRKHYEKQQKVIKAYQGHFNLEELVFCNSKGTFKDPNNLLREFNHIIKTASLPKVTIHNLRHLHATLMLKNGENPKVVSERLGHSRIGITMDTYSHVVPDIQDAAALRFEEAYLSKQGA